jgi:spermidine/putrescine transport system substrate-binding protein
MSNLFWPRSTLSLWTSPFGFLLLLATLSMLSCTKKDSVETNSSRVVNLAIWSNFFSPEMQKKFTEQTGIKLNITNYSSNEELLAKVQSKNSGIDLAVPSDYMVDIMQKLSLLAKLDKAAIPNLKLIDTKWLKQPYDLENVHSLPYSWSTSGIAVNRELYKGKITGWKDFLYNPDLSGKISLLDDSREVIGIGLRLNGHSVNSKSPDHLEKAKKTLFEIRPRIKAFRSDTIDFLLNKEVIAAQVYSPDALQAVKRSAGTIEYILPIEGSTRAIDNLVIIAGSKNYKEAHELINFFLSTEVNVNFVSNILGGPVLTQTAERLPNEIRNMKNLNPDEKILSKFERIVDVGDSSSAFDRIWTEIKSHE